MASLTATIRLMPLLMLCTSCAVSADLGGTMAPPFGSNDASTTAATIDALTVEAASDASAEPSPGEPIEVEAGADAVAPEATIDVRPTSDAPVDAPPDRASMDAAVPTSCNDNLKDNGETDIDCGGSCPPCGMAQHCLANSDCGTWPGCDPILGCACDAVSLTCVYNHCSDLKQDLTETAVDCGGGECAGCGPNKGCILDSDCSQALTGCDINKGGCFCDLVSQACVFNHCFDHKEDSSETATDCGGGQCPGCVLGQNCMYDYDCASSACDAISWACVSNQCVDHRQDGDETDVDCGGAACGGCALGKKCKTSFDCAAGLCNPGTPHLCN